MRWVCGIQEYFHSFLFYWTEPHTSLSVLLKVIVQDENWWICSWKLLISFTESWVCVCSVRVGGTRLASGHIQRQNGPDTWKLHHIHLIYTSRKSLTHRGRGQTFRIINKDRQHSLIVTLLTDYWGGIWTIDLLYLLEEMTNPKEEWRAFYVMTDFIFRELSILFYV